MASSLATNGEGRDVGSGPAGSSAHVTAPHTDMGVNEVEYESDAEENLPLVLRRRNASDDEEDGEEERVTQGFVDEESEGEGAAPPLEDEEDDDDDEEVEEEYEEDVVQRIIVQGSEEEEEDGDAENAGDETAIHRPRHSGGGGADRSPPKDDQGIGSPGSSKDHQAEEEKKEAEPFAVPTAGAFYMHDDRFRDNGGARPRRSAGGRKLWEAKDDRAWVHDRFEELNLQDDITYHEGQRRGGRGRFRGRGKGRGGGRGLGRANKSRIFEDSNVPAFVRRGGGRGRGSKRNEAEVKNAGDGLKAQNKQAPKPLDTVSRSNAGETSLQPMDAQFDGVVPRKHAIGSSLNSASPPFYPSGSSHQSFGMPVKREPQYGGGVGSIPSSSAVMPEEEISVSNASVTARNGKNIVSVRGQSPAHVESPSRSNVGKQPTNMQLQPSRSSSVNLLQQQQSKVQGKSPVGGGQPTNQPTNSGHQINRGSNPTQTQPTVHQRMGQSQGQGGPRVSSQQAIQQVGSSSQSSPRPSTSEVGSASSPTGSNKNRNIGVGRGRGSVQGAARGSFVYNGTQSVGGTSGMSVAHAEQSFPHTPALLPVMQFGGQHHAGFGVPAVGMALPGYVAQPQLGFGNSEMTWVPVLAGAAGALGATYCSPYIAVDSAYYAQSTAQPASFSVAGRDSNGNKPSLWKAPPRAELVNDEFGQRQNKPRRYSEMNFGP